MRDLSRLFSPKTIAVVGGGAWGRNIIKECRKIGFSGDIWPVHPKADQICGLEVVRAVSDLPSAPDAVFIGVNREITIEVVRDLARMGAGGAVCFASGFLEAQNETEDGAELQQKLVAAAGDMPIVGPNCYGFINYLDQVCLWPDQHGGIPVERGVALLTQSSNIAINLTMQARGLPIAMVMTAGNQAQTSQAEIGRALLSDPRITALGIHIEGFQSVKDFEELARYAKSLNKGIVALKVGASDQAQQATVSHTASLAGSDAGARAVLKRLGCAQVDSLAAMIEALKILHVFGPLGGTRVASMSCSGGEASLMADAGERAGIEFPPLSGAQRTDLRAALGDKVALANPLDYHTYVWGHGEAMGSAFAAMMQGPVDLGVLIVDFPRSDRCDPSAWDCVIDAAKYVRRACDIPFACLSSLAENMPEDVAKDLFEIGVVPLNGLEESLAAIKACRDMVSELTDAALLLSHSPVQATTWSEATSKAQLARYGVQSPKSISTDVSGLAEAFEHLGGPCVLKGVGFEHKSEAGAVVVGITSQEHALSAAHAMGCDQFLIEEMVQGCVTEVLIGVVHDPVHGFVLTLAAGGVLTEVLQDSMSLMVPSSRAEVEDALSQLKIAKLLQGYRGAPPADIEAIIDTVMAVQRFVLDHHDRLEEIEINPLFARPNGAIAVDALIRIGD